MSIYFQHKAFITPVIMHSIANNPKRPHNMVNPKIPAIRKPNNKIKSPMKRNKCISR